MKKNNNFGGKESLRWERKTKSKGEYWNINYQKSILKEIFWEEYRKGENKGLSVKTCMSNAKECTENYATINKIKINYPK